MNVQRHSVPHIVQEKAHTTTFSLDPATIFFHREVSGVREHCSWTAIEESQHEYQDNTCIASLLALGMGDFPLALL